MDLMGNQLGLKNLIVFLREQPVFPKVSVGYSVLADLVDQGDSEAMPACHMVQGIGMYITFQHQTACYTET